MPAATPNANIAAISTTWPGASPNEIGSSATANPPAITGPRLPNRSTSAPATGATANEPAGPASSTSPSMPLDKFRPCASAGIRASQSPLVMPSRAKNASRARRACRSLPVT